MGKAAPSALPPQWDLSSLYTSAEGPSFKKDLASASLQAERLSSLCDGRVADLPPKEYGEMLGDERDSYKEAEDRMLTEKLLGRLTQEEREIVTLTVFGECDSSEVARLLSLNRNTVRSKYSRALQKMKAAFGGMT